MRALILIAAVVAFAAAQGQSEQVKIDAIVESSMKGMHIPGLAYAVVKDGKVIYQGARGLANVEYEAKATVDTSFLIASVTKQFTAAGIMKLVEEGKIDVGAKISTYLDDAPESWSGITVRHLLNHTAGLTDRWEDEDVSKWRIAYLKSTMYEASKAKKPLAKPGESWTYSDQGYFLLGMIIEKVSGKLYADYLAETFFKPLGMNASRTEVMMTVMPGLATGYSQVQGTWIHNGRRTQYGMTSHFGVISTVGDLAKWATALMDGKVLKPETLRKMWSPGQLNDGNMGWTGFWSYGFGWFLRDFAGHPVVQHAGSTGTNLTILPDQKVAVVVLTNLEQLAGGDATSIAQAIYRVICPEMGWASQKKIEDKDGFGQILEAELGRMAEGKMDESVYAERFGKVVKGMLSRQQAGLSNFGPISSIELLEEHSIGKEKVSYYKVAFKSITLYASVRRNAAGKMEYLGLEGE